MFDGVGGFIVGLENSSKEVFQTLYSNQYLYRFPNMEHIGTDVALIPNEKFEEMKQNGVDMIVGGFPCQDYSVARSKKNELGIEGKKGVLFWEIIRATEVIKPKYLVLENVDRLLKAPSSQRGRDFAVMLAAFNELGYSVEWRVINAADYGIMVVHSDVVGFSSLYLEMIQNGVNAYIQHMKQHSLKIQI
ncbi:MAG: DNA (cytosine-5-)-methyltransferase [Veillonella sp.]|nr:DNA (cytosine-5-)-methyltransferase [Veillonella sp.]